MRQMFRTLFTASRLLSLVTYVLISIPCGAGTVDQTLKHNETLANLLRSMQTSDEFKRGVAVMDMISLAALQVNSSSPLTFDAADCERLALHFEVFSRVFMGGRVGRQANSSDKDLIKHLDEHERLTWNELDAHLTDEARAGLRDLFPSMTAAIRSIRPGMFDAVLITHLIASNYNYAQTADLFGGKQMKWTIAKIFVETQLEKFGLRDRERSFVDYDLAQGLLGLARYLRVSTKAGFCERALLSESKDSTLPIGG